LKLSADIFSSNLATAPQGHLFLSCIIKLLIHATLSLSHPASQASFLSRIMRQERSVVIIIDFNLSVLVFGSYKVKTQI